MTLESIADWLGSRDDNLYRLLTKNFIEGSDYKKEVGEKARKSGITKTNILLTGDCLKRLCLRSRAKNAEQVRTYFILMEKLYRDYMMDSIEDRISNEDEKVTQEKRKSQRERPAKDYEIGHCVYLIEIDPTGRGNKLVNEMTYKVGRTNNLNIRAAVHFRQRPGFVKVIYQKMCPSHKFLETCIHEALGSLEIESEEFTEEPQEIIDIIDYCMEVREKLCKFSGSCLIGSQKSTHQIKKFESKINSKIK